MIVTSDRKGLPPVLENVTIDVADIRDQKKKKWKMVTRIEPDRARRRRGVGDGDQEGFLVEVGGYV